MVTEAEKQKNIKFNQDVFAIGFAILIFKLYIMDASLLIRLPSFVDSVCKAGFCLCMVWKLINQSYRIWQVVFLAILGSLCLYTSLNINNFYLVFTFLGIVAMQNVDLKYVLKRTYMVKFVIVAVHVVIYFINLVVNPSSLIFSSRTGEDKRHFFYLGHANTFSGVVLWISLEFIYVNYDKLKKWHLAAIVGINWFFYLFADSNTCMTAILIITGLLLLDKMQIHVQDKIVDIFARFGFLVLTVVCAMACAFYTKLSGSLLEAFKAANEFFTGRLLFGAYVYDTNGFTFLGRTLTFAEKTHWREYWFDTMVFDNAYIWMLVLGGSLYLALISIGFILITRKADYLMKVMLIAYIIYGITEAYIINAASCFPILFIGMIIHGTNREEKPRKVDLEKELIQERRQTAYEKIKHLNSGV